MTLLAANHGEEWEEEWTRSVEKDRGPHRQQASIMVKHTGSECRHSKGLVIPVALYTFQPSIIPSLCVSLFRLHLPSLTPTKSGPYLTRPNGF